MTKDSHTAGGSHHATRAAKLLFDGLTTAQLVANVATGPVPQARLTAAASPDVSSVTSATDEQVSQLSDHQERLQEEQRARGLELGYALRSPDVVIEDRHRRRER